MFKIVFLLALDSGKCRPGFVLGLMRTLKSKQFSLYPSLSFISKHQLSWDGIESVAPGIILALPPTLDKSLKEYRTLQSEQYITTWTRPLISEKARILSLSHSRRVLLASHCSNLFLDQADCALVLLSEFENALKLYQIKVHDFRAFGASKAFNCESHFTKSFQACHWKSCNTITEFIKFLPYLADMDSHPTFLEIIQVKWDFLKVGNKKREYLAPSSKNMEHYSHLAREQDTTGQDQSNAQDIFSLL